MIKRISLFAAVNLAVVVSVSAIIHLSGFRSHLTAQGIDYEGLLVFCAVFGFGGAFISLQISRWIAKKALGVVLLEPHRPESQGEVALLGKIRSLCTSAGLVTMPEVGIYPSPEVNAFVTGPSRERALLAISTGMLDEMDGEAIEGVLGHEISHIANGDMVTMTLIQGVVNTFVMFAARIVSFGIDSFLRGDDEEGGLGFFAHMFLVIFLEAVLMILASPLIYYFSRQREYKADAGSARLVGPEAMIHALSSLRDCRDSVDNRHGTLSTLKIHGRAQGLIPMIYSSHPSLEARIAALKAGTSEAVEKTFSTNGEVMAASSAP